MYKHELNEKTSLEIEKIVGSIELAKIDMQKKFKSIFDEFNDAVYQNMIDCIEIDMKYNIERWIRERCTEIVNGILSGETQYLKDQWIISEYDWEKVHKIRLAILKSSSGEIENCVINTLQKENEELKRVNKMLRRDY